MSNKKKLYWLVESNDGDLSVTTPSLDTVKDLIDGDFDSIEKEDQPNAQYTVSPVYYTEEEYENLPEAD